LLSHEMLRSMVNKVSILAAEKFDSELIVQKWIEELSSQN